MIFLRCLFTPALIFSDLMGFHSVCPNLHCKFLWQGLPLNICFCSNATIEYSSDWNIGGLLQGKQLLILIIHVTVMCLAVPIFRSWTVFQQEE